MPKLSHIEGIGPSNEAKLNEAGIKNTDKLLLKGATKKGRAELAETAGISEHLILEWINHIDLYRIKGVGSEYADLLESGGVDTVTELAVRNASHLNEKLSKLNEEKNLVRKLPTIYQLEDWISQAKKLPRVIQY